MATAQLTPAREDARSRWAGVSLEVGLVAAALALNLLVRWYTRGDLEVAVANAADVLALEQRLGVDWEHAVQELTLGVPGLAWFCAAYYVWGYLPSVLGTLAWLYVRHPEAYPRLRNALLASGAVGLLGYAFYPTAPPRLTDFGYGDTVAAAALGAAARPSGIANEIAAIPSFHVGWLALAALAGAAVVRSNVLRLLLLLQPVLMSYVIVATANHWVLDVPTGLVLLLVGLVAARLTDRRHAQARLDAPVRVVVP